MKFLCWILRGHAWCNVLECRNTHGDSLIVWECSRCGKDYEERY